MADNQDKSDDLIAELAKLMASSAQGNETENKPSVIKLTPLSEATAPASAVRIPGMDANSAGAVRIPGHDSAASQSEAAPEAPGEPVIETPQPDSWAPQGAATDSTPESEITEGEAIPEVLAPEAPAALLSGTGLPDLGFNQHAESAPQPERDFTSDDFNFDFGFGAPAAPTVPVTPDADIDPIADLIAAELDAPAAPESGGPLATGPQSTFGAEPAPFGRANVEPTPAPGIPAVDVPPPTVPVFGASSAAASSPTHGDPLDEIESLIGEAVRVQLAEPDPVAPQVSEPLASAPVVPPLTTGFAPRRAELKDLDRASQSAEAAILAAAAATGADVGRVEAPESPGAEGQPYRRMAVRPPNTSFLSGPMRQYVGMGVAALLLLAAGFGLYSVLGMGRADPESAPVLAADTGPVKEPPPAAAAANAAEEPRSVVFDEIDGVDTAAANETLVSRDQTAGASAAEVARVATTEATDAIAESGLANRKVRTVTVRPDGTIVSAADAVAGTELLPVERPNVPELPGAVPPSDLLAAARAGATPALEDAASAAANGDPIASIVANTNEAAGAAEAAPTELAALAPESETPVVFNGALSAPVPMPRPTDRSAMINGSPRSTAPVQQNSAIAPASIPLTSLTQGATTAPTAQTPAAPVATGGGSAAFVQLASLPTEADARNQSAAMQSRWGNLLGGRSLVVERAELSGGRVTYRVRLPAASLQSANEICSSIKANGGDCFAANS